VQYRVPCMDCPEFRPALCSRLGRSRALRRPHVGASAGGHEPPPSTVGALIIEADRISNDVTAAIVQKTDRSQVRALYLLVRASACDEDKAVSISQQDVNQLQPEMLVRMF
jgi:hypothetical protein